MTDLTDLDLPVRRLVNLMRELGIVELERSGLRIKLASNQPPQDAANAARQLQDIKRASR